MGCQFAFRVVRTPEQKDALEQERANGGPEWVHHASTPVQEISAQTPDDDDDGWTPWVTRIHSTPNAETPQLRAPPLYSADDVVKTVQDSDGCGGCNSKRAKWLPGVRPKSSSNVVIDTIDKDDIDVSAIEDEDGRGFVGTFLGPKVVHVAGGSCSGACAEDDSSDSEDELEHVYVALQGYESFKIDSPDVGFRPRRPEDDASMEDADTSEVSTCGRI